MKLWTSVAYTDVGKGREHNHMDLGTPLRGVWEVEQCLEQLSRSGSLLPCGVWVN